MLHHKVAISTNDISESRNVDNLFTKLQQVLGLPYLIFVLFASMSAIVSNNLNKAAIRLFHRLETITLAR